jgi:type I restriction enzyme S subunit
MFEALDFKKQLQQSVSGMLPEGWEVCPIEDKLADIIDYRGKTPKKTTSGIPLITAKNVRDGYLDPEPREYIREEDYDRWMTRGIPDLGDVLFTTEAPLGNVARFPGYKAALAQRLLTLRNKPDELDSGYLFWTLVWSDSRQRLEQWSTGSTVLGIKQSIFRKIVFRFPPLPEQQKIAQILDTIDQLITVTDTHITKLKKTKAGLLHDLLTRGIDEHGELRDPTCHPEQFQDSPLGRIPKDWEVKSLGEACCLVKDGTHLPPERVEDGPLLLSVQNMINGEFKLTDSDTRISWNFYRKMHQNWAIKIGDVLLAIVGATLGKTAVVPDMPPFTLQRSVAVLRGHADFLDNSFLHLYISSERFQITLWQRVNQTAQPGIYLTEIDSLHIPRPQIDEQKKITIVLQKHSAQIKAKEAYLEKLKLLKKGLMTDLLTGKVRVKLEETEDN